MSLSVEDPEKSRIGALTRDNYTTWIEKVKDYILSLDHDEAAEIWQAFVWTQPEGHNDPDPAERDYQTAANTQERKLRVQHNKAFRFIRATVT